MAGVGQWHPTTVHSILVNEGYAGCVFYNQRIGTRQVKRPKEEWVPIAIPPIVPADVFQAAEVQRQETTADEQRAEVQEELLTLDAALAKCDREAQRWAEAYAAEVIDIRELKGYRAEIEARPRSRLAQQAACQARLDVIGQAVGQVEALNARVTWTPGLPLAIEGTIPFDAIAPTSALRGRCSSPR